MKSKPYIPLSLFLLLTVFYSLEVKGQDLSVKASTFLNSLPKEIRDKATFPFDHGERFNWHFIPRDRKGPTFHDFDETQKEAAMALLRASLSQQGYDKATSIIALEDILRQIENRPENDSYRDPLNYHFSIFGTPSSDKEWGWRLEGHHISLNFSSSSGKIVSSTPSFLGTNPAIVPSGKYKGKQVLDRETNLGFDFLHSLDDTQLKKAKYSDKAPNDIITGNDRKATYLEPRGILYSELTEDQKELFMELLKVYMHNFSEEFSGEFWKKKIQEADIENFSFAWAGSTVNKIGEPHYYRIQGPTILIEYDNVQNDANHVHTVIRDLTNDFGEDILQSHYLHGHAHR